MEFPLIIFLIVYLVMVTLFVVFSVFLVYHALRFGVATGANVFTLLLYLAVSTGILLWSLGYVAGIDWSSSIVVF